MPCNETRAPIPRRVAAAATLVLVAASASACAKKPPPPSLDVSSPQQSPESIPDAPLSGKIHGNAFKLLDARYYVDQRRGFEKIDILLGGAEAKDRCGPSQPKDATSVWLRRVGPDKVAPEKVTGKPRDKGPWEVHYQTRDKEGWVGNGDSAYLLVVREVRPDKTIVGDLSVCFADHEKSCVSGSFEAYYCPIAIDAPVRGAEPPEPIPDKYLRRAMAPASAAPMPTESAAPAASATPSSATSNAAGAPR